MENVIVLSLVIMLVSSIRKWAKLKGSACGGYSICQSKDI
jgi:hypothetical protein